MSHLDDQISLQTHSISNTLKKKIFRSAITLCSTHVWLGSRKPHGKKAMAPTDPFPTRALLLLLQDCSLQHLRTPPKPLPILDHYRRWCPVGVDLQCMTVVQLRSALKLLQPARSSAFRWFAFLNQHSSPASTAFIPFYHFPCCVSPALFNTWLPNHCVSLTSLSQMFLLLNTHFLQDPQRKRLAESF